MTIENKKVQAPHYGQRYYESFIKNKIEKYLHANQKYLAEFYIGLTLAMYFQMLDIKGT